LCPLGRFLRKTENEDRCGDDDNGPAYAKQAAEGAGGPTQNPETDCLHDLVAIHAGQHIWKSILRSMRRELSGPRSKTGRGRTDNRARGSSMLQS
jgi:hypothetical protein